MPSGIGRFLTSSPIQACSTKVYCSSTVQPSDNGSSQVSKLNVNTWDYHIWIEARKGKWWSKKDGIDSMLDIYILAWV